MTGLRWGSAGKATSGADGPRRPVAAVALLRAAHIGPALAVTCAVALLAFSTDLPTWRGLLLVAAVLAGQLTWVGATTCSTPAGTVRLAARTSRW